MQQVSMRFTLPAGRFMSRMPALLGCCHRPVRRKRLPGAQGPVGGKRQHGLPHELQAHPHTTLHRNLALAGLPTERIAHKLELPGFSVPAGVR